MTVKCANCDKDSIYKVVIPGIDPIFYCHKDLPMRLHDRAMRGDFALPIEEPKIVAPVVVAEDIPAETPVEEKKPVKKAAPKANGSV